MYFYSIFKFLTSENNQGVVSFSFSDFFTDLNLKDGQKTRTLIKESANEILDMKIVLEDNEKQYDITNVSNRQNVFLLKQPFLLSSQMQ